MYLTQIYQHINFNITPDIRTLSISTCNLMFNRNESNAHMCVNKYVYKTYTCIDLYTIIHCADRKSVLFTFSVVVVYIYCMYLVFLF